MLTKRNNHTIVQSAILYRARQSLFRVGQQHMIIIQHHRSVVRCWPWAGASPPDPQGREEAINHKILIIKGTKVDLAVRQVGLRGVRVLGVTGGFCGRRRPLFYFVQVVYYSCTLTLLQNAIDDIVRWQQKTRWRLSPNFLYTYAAHQRVYLADVNNVIVWRSKVHRFCVKLG